MPSLPTTQATIKTALDGKPDILLVLTTRPPVCRKGGQGQLYIRVEEEWEREHMGRRAELAPSLDLPCSVKCIKDVEFCYVCLCVFVSAFVDVYNSAM